MEDTEHAEQEREGQPRFPLALSQRITPSDGKERILPQKRSPQCAPLMWCFFWMAPEGANCPLISTVFGPGGQQWACAVDTVMLSYLDYASDTDSG